MWSTTIQNTGNTTTFSTDRPCFLIFITLFTFSFVRILDGGVFTPLELKRTLSPQQSLLLWMMFLSLRILWCRTTQVSYGCQILTPPSPHPLFFSFFWDLYSSASLLSFTFISVPNRGVGNLNGFYCHFQLRFSVWLTPQWPGSLPPLHWTSVLSFSIYHSWILMTPLQTFRATPRSFVGTPFLLKFL